MLVNVRIQTIKNRGVCNKRRPSVLEYHAAKKCQAWFPWYHNWMCVFMFADETTRHGFTDTRKRQNSYIFFIRSRLYSCRNVIFIVSVISKEKSWTKYNNNKQPPSFCTSVFCALAKAMQLLNIYFSCLAFLFPTFTMLTTCFRKWHDTKIYTAHMKLSVLMIQ